MPPHLAAWFEALATRLARNDHAGAMAFLLERSPELLALPGGPEALVEFLARVKGPGRHLDPWSLVLSADLEPLVNDSAVSVEHALGVFAALELDRAVRTSSCEICEQGFEGDGFLRFARSIHHIAAGRFATAIAELDALACEDDLNPLFRALIGLVAARAVLRTGEAVDGAHRLESIEATPGTGVAALIEVHLLRAKLSAGNELDHVCARSAELRDAEGPTVVRELARRLHDYALVLTGQSPGRVSFESGPEAYLDAAEVACLAGQRTPVPPILAIAAACSRDGRNYLEARARIVAAIASFAEGTPAARLRAEQEIERARTLCRGHGYRHLDARCDLVLAIAAGRVREVPHESERRLETVLEQSSLVTMLERLAEAVLHRRRVEELEAGDTRLLELLGFAHLPAFSVDDGTGARLVGALDLERWRGRADLVVDLDRSEIVVRDRVVRGQARLVSLLAHLVSSGARPVEADELFRKVWNARVYTPLRHRNAVYLAISRARRILAAALGDAPIVRHPSGWCLRDDLYAIVVRRAPESGEYGPVSEVLKVTARS